MCNDRAIAVQLDSANINNIQKKLVGRRGMLKIIHFLQQQRSRYFLSGNEPELRNVRCEENIQNPS